MNEIWEKYKKINIIGRGAYADVYKDKNKNTDEYIVIKEIKNIKVEEF